MYSAPVATSANHARLVLTGLAAGSEYTYAVEADATAIAGVTGRFRTAPAGAGNFLVAFAGDASELSNHVVFDTIRGLDPLLFIHLGDMHYRNVAINSAANYRACRDEVMAQARQARLYRDVPTAYVWDDHDFGDNNCDSSTVGKVPASIVYRERTPHYPLGDASASGPIYHTFDVGRLRFVVTDQRYAATANAATDNASKSMLGAAQKTWFKALLSGSPGKVIVWVCPRMFGGVPTAGADHWGGFTTERTELAAYIHANCPGRVLVLSADMHALGIDDGTNHTYGSEPFRVFQAAPLDRSVDVSGYGGSLFTSGLFATVGQFGTMTVVDAGGASVSITWRGYDSAGTVLATQAFAVAV